MSQTTSPSRSEAPSLVPVLGERVAIGPLQFALALWFGLFFLYFNYIPIFHSDIWGHVAYGQWILEHRSLPAEDPFVRLAEGVPITDTAWLGQVIFAAAQQAAGPESISHIFAVTVLAAYLVLARVFYLQTGRVGVATFGAILVWLVAWSRHAIVRPEIFGSLCFAALFWLVVRTDEKRARRTAEQVTAATRRPWVLWIGVPLLFAAWANLHGSFVVGYIVLGSYLLGRSLEVAWTTGSLFAVLADREFRRWLIAGELAVAGTLLNPYGIDLILHTFLFPGNPNLDDVLEWFPLEMVSYEGIEIGVSWILMLVLLRHSRARMRPADVVLLALMTLSTCIHVRMVTWYAAALIVVLVPHLADVALQMRESRWGRRLSRLGGSWTARSYRYTLFAGLAAWCCFAFSPISAGVLGGSPRALDRVYGRDTPRDVTEYLRAHPPVGQIANPQWWGDWLAWDGPPGLEVFMTTNAVHAAPRRVWRDYLVLARGDEGFERRLDRYRVNTIVVHKELQQRLTTRVRRLSGWKIVYEDDLAIIATRGNAINNNEKAGAEQSRRNDDGFH